jgi:hypothetical protein
VGCGGACRASSQLAEGAPATPRATGQAAVTIARCASSRRESHDRATAKWEGRPPTTVNAGDVFFVPAETVHAVKNVGSGNAAELATCVVEKGKPLLVLAE